jgi:hypothetical protein
MKVRTQQRRPLAALIQKGNAPARPLRRAHTLLLADEEPPAPMIAAVRQMSAVTVTQTGQRSVTAGLEAALDDQPPPGACRTLDGRQAAHLLALAGNAPPLGRDRRSVRLLADRAVALGLVEARAYAPVRRVRKKPRSSRG